MPINIATYLKDMACRQPEQLAVMFPASRDRSGQSTYTSLTFRQLDDESDYIAAGLTKTGIGRGVRTVLMVPPSLEFFSLTFALFKAGAVPVFIDPGMGLKNIGKCLTEAKPAAFIGITKAHIARWLFGWGKESLTKFVRVGGRITSRMSVSSSSSTLFDLKRVGREICESLEATVTHKEGVGTGVHNQNKQTSAMGRIADTSASDMAAILFTSGSTGVPKGAVYSHGNFVAQVEMLKRVFGIEPGEVDLCTFPLFALFASALGMTAIIPRMDFTRPARVNPNEIAVPINRFHVANVFGSPALLNRVGRHYSGGPIRATALDRAELADVEKLLAQPLFPSVRRVLSAGAPVAPAIIARFSELLSPAVQIFTPYGATESLPVAVIGSREVLGETRNKTAQGAGTCVGRPVEGIKVSIIRITDEPILEWSDSMRMPLGEIGEIVVQGPQVTHEYFNRPDLTALAKIRMSASDDATPFHIAHRMGDVGYFDEQGRLWFCGRKSHRVVTDDRTYFTEPVEGIFNTHPEVFRSALVGVQRQGKIQPVLCVELESDCMRSDKDKLTRELLELGARFETTRPIQTILFHKSFPVDIRHNSKIFREKLAIWAAKRLRW